MHLFESGYHLDDIQMVYFYFYFTFMEWTWSNIFVFHEKQIREGCIDIIKKENRDIRNHTSINCNLSQKIIHKKRKTMLTSEHIKRKKVQIGYRRFALHLLHVTTQAILSNCIFWNRKRNVSRSNLNALDKTEDGRLSTLSLQQYVKRNCII